MSTEKSLLLYLRRVIGISLMSIVPLCLATATTGIKFDGYLNSLSGTYWTCARDLFVLLLGMTSIFMCLYKGYNIADRIINSISGICLLLIIIFPTFSKSVLGSNPRVDYNLFPFFNQRASSIIHLVATAVATVCFAINSLFLFTKHSGEITNKKRIRNIVYKVGGIIIVAVFVFSTVLIIMDKTGYASNIFPRWTCAACQSIELLAVGFVWIVKGESLRFFNDEAEKQNT